MNAAQTARLEEIKSHYISLDSSTDEYMINGAMPYLRAMAKSKIAMDEIKRVMTDRQNEGFAVPAYVLGVAKPPRTWGTTMADARTAYHRASKSQMIEAYGANVRI